MIKKLHYPLRSSCILLRSWEPPKFLNLKVMKDRSIGGMKLSSVCACVCVFPFDGFDSFPQFLERFQCPSIGLSKANLRFLDIAMACYWLLRILKGHEVMPDVGHSSKHKFLDQVFF